MAEEWIEVSSFIPADQADELFRAWLATTGCTMADLEPSDLRVDTGRGADGDLRRYRLRQGWLLDVAARRRAELPPEQFAPGAVRVMADYHAFPLWCADRATAQMLGHCPSQQLRERLSSWGHEYTQNNLREDWLGHADWVARGRELAVQVRSEISSPEVRVFYLEESKDENVDDNWVEIAR
jgi:hypothetical protein